MLSRVKRADRDRFRENLGSIGISNAFALIPVVKTDTEHFVYRFAVAGTDHLTVRLNRIDSHILGRDKLIHTLSILPQSEQGRVVAGKVITELKSLFPTLRRSDISAYRLAYENGSGNPRVTEFFLGHPLLYRLMQLVLFAAIGLLIVGLVVKRRPHNIGTT